MRQNDTEINENDTKIKVNYKQVGSDRITNAISLTNKKDNFIILDFGTATTFDVVIKNKYFKGRVYIFILCCN